jgi:hypothetical protein
VTIKENGKRNQRKSIFRDGNLNPDDVIKEAK